MFENHWRATDALMERLGLRQEIRDSVGQTFERWDGKGEPSGAKGDDVLLSSRLVNLADVVEVFHRAGGVDAAVAVARARRGSQFDPGLVDLFARDARDVFAELESVSSWDAVMAVERRLGVALSTVEHDAALEAIADFVDLKSPYTLGHSRGPPNWPARLPRPPGWRHSTPRRSAGRRWSTISVGSACPTRSGTRPQR